MIKLDKKTEKHFKCLEFVWFDELMYLRDTEYDWIWQSVASNMKMFLIEQIYSEAHKISARRKVESHSGAERPGIKISSSIIIHSLECCKKVIECWPRWVMKWSSFQPKHFLIEPHRVFRFRSGSYSEDSRERGRWLDLSQLQNAVRQRQEEKAHRHLRTWSLLFVHVQKRIMFDLRQYATASASWRAAWGIKW